MLLEKIHYDNAAERELLGWTLGFGLDVPSCGQYMRVMKFVEPKHFGDPLHANIYMEIQSLFAEGCPIVPHKITATLNRYSEFVERGGIDYLRALVRDEAWSENIFDHVERVLITALRRAWIGDFEKA